MTTKIEFPSERGRGAVSRSVQVYEALVARLRRGELAPGTRMREDELANMLGVSRTPVREALARLQSRGLVEAVQGGLAVVELSRARTLEVYALRAIMEGAAARFAALNASAADLSLLAQALRQFSAFEGDASGFARINAAFHQVIYEAAHNSYLMRTLDDLNDSLALLPSTTFVVNGRPALADQEHRRIVAAIEARDPDAAERAARHHIDQALKARLELLF